MEQAPGAKLWHAVVRLKEGRSHAFYYLVDGKPFGANLNVPVFGPEKLRARWRAKGPALHQWVDVVKH